MKKMKITWVTRSFLDYRIPVYEAINSLSNNNLTVIYFKDVVPDRCQIKLGVILGNRAIGLRESCVKKKEMSRFTQHSQEIRKSTTQDSHRIQPRFN